MSERLFSEDVAKELDELASKITPNMDVYGKIKNLLNSSFGEENNQIIQPSSEAYQMYLSLMGFSDEAIKELSFMTACKWFSRTCLTQHTVFIRFPEVIIKNSSGKNHRITDLFVFFPIDGDGRLASPNLYGFRSSISPAEYSTGYLHSHLPRVNSATISNGSYFCLGQGQIRQAMALLVSSFTEINFKVFILHIKKYVSWESLEGSTYVSISEIRNSSVVSQDEQISNTGVMEAVRIIRADFWSRIREDAMCRFLNVQFKGNYVEVTPTEEMDEWIINEIRTRILPTNIGLSSPLSILYHKSANGTLIKASQSVAGTSRDYSLPKKLQIRFKGEEIRMSFNNNKITSKQKLYAEPKIVQELCKSLGREIYYAATRIESDFRREYTLKDKS